MGATDVLIDPASLAFMRGATLRLQKFSCRSSLTTCGHLRWSVLKEQQARPLEKILSEDLWLTCLAALFDDHRATREWPQDALNAINTNNLLALQSLGRMMMASRWCWSRCSDHGWMSPLEQLAVQVCSAGDEAGFYEELDMVVCKKPPLRNYDEPRFAVALGAAFQRDLSQQVAKIRGQDNQDVQSATSHTHQLCPLLQRLKQYFKDRPPPSYAMG